MSRENLSSNTAKSKTVTVRIAVSVQPGGWWQAAGFDGCEATLAADLAARDMKGPQSLVWITAEVPLPDASAEVRGEVED